MNKTLNNFHSPNSKKTKFIKASYLRKRNPNKFKFLTKISCDLPMIANKRQKRKDY